MWLHVDAAYGGFAALTERGRAALAGIELADSVTLDPHKWLYQPIECGCLLVREGRLAAEAFTINPDYLADYKSEEVNFSDLGVQLTRTARALKIWLSFNYFGVDAFREAIDRAIDLAQLAERRSETRPSSSCSRRPRSGLSASGGGSRESTRTRSWPSSTRSWLPGSGDRTRARVLDPAARDVRDPHVRHEPHQRAGRRHRDAGLVCAGGRPELPGGPI